MIEHILDRLSEASTWRGIVALLTAGGIALSPEQMAAIVSAGLAMIGLFGVFTSDK
jgi:hypothetical protein